MGLLSAVGSLLGGGGSFFEGKKITQEPLETPEQSQARKLLLQLAQGGSVGGFTAGEAFGGPLGNFAMTDAEQAAGLGIQGRLGQQNQNVSTAAGFLRDLAGQGFDPEGAQFQAFRKAANRATQDASSVLDREAAIQGSRFSTGIGKEKGYVLEKIKHRDDYIDAEQSIEEGYSHKII